MRDTDITTRGKTFRVMCTVKDEDFVGWFLKDGQKVTTMVGEDELSGSHFYVSKNDDEYSLIIQNVKVADGGTFQCRGNKQTRNFTLYIECKYTMLVSVPKIFF